MSGPDVPAEPRGVRGCGSVVFRGLTGLAVGGAAGALGFSLVGQSEFEGALIGGTIGLVVWVPVGVFLWATFPYKDRG